MSKSRILWVTNLPAPYRLPVWNSLADLCDLDIWLLASRTETDENVVDRVKDWLEIAEQAQLPTMRTMATREVTFQKTPYYVLNSVPDLSSYDGIVLGGWESPAYWQLMSAAKRLGITVCGFYESHTASSHHVAGPVSLARKRFFRKLDTVVVPGEASERAVLGFGVDRQRIHRGFNAVDVSRFAEAAAGVTPDPRGILYVGQLIPRKNVDSLIRSLAWLPQDVTLTICGSGKDEGELKRLTGELSLADRVDFLGFQTYGRIAEIMAAHAHFVLASREEVWGLVVNEALACGSHAVVSERCGVAASVHAMPGVFTCGVEPQSIASSLRCSLASWRGRIESPEILSATPEAFAGVFASALRVRTA